MDDLISRQATLNALMEAVKSVGVLDADDIKTVFDMLPSVQQEKAQLTAKGTTSDLISRQAAIESIGECAEAAHDNHEWDMGQGYLNAIECIEEEPPAQPEPQWIPIKWHDCTDEDREKYGFSNDIVAVFDCEMPDDDQPILVTTSHGYVNQDVCYIDDGYSLDSGWDWIDDIKAWMPLPEPYKPNNK